MASTSVPALSASYAEGDRKGVRSQIRSVTRFIMAISFPCMVGLMVLSQPLMVLLFGDADPISGKMLFYGALAVPFYSLSTLSNGILQGIDKMKIPVRNAALTIIFHVLMLLVLMVVFHMNIFAVVIANIFNGLFLTILNDLSVKRYSGVRLNIKKTYLIPLLSAVIMGAFVYLAYFVVDYIVGITAVSVLIATLVGMFSYFVLIIKLKGITEDELYRFPKGGTLIALARKMHLL
jgi:stage V sporulation protein B